MLRYWINYLKAVTKIILGVMALFLLFWLMSYIDEKTGMYEKYSINNPIKGGVEK